MQAQWMGRGPEVVLVHGWGLHGGVWGELVTRLAKRFRVTVVDLPGYGQNRELPQSYTLQALAANVLAVVANPVLWVGWSLGAMIGLAAAGAQPNAIAGMVLVGATPRFVHGPDWAHGVEPARIRQLSEDLRCDWRAALLRFASLQAGAETEARTVVRRLRTCLLNGRRPRLEALQAGLQLLLHADLRRDLGGVRMPVRVIHGECDRLVPLAAATYLAERLPTGELIAVPGSGHAPFLLHAPLFERALAGLPHA